MPADKQPLSICEDARISSPVPAQLIPLSVLLPEAAGVFGNHHITVRTVMSVQSQIIGNTINDFFFLFAVPRDTVPAPCPGVYSAGFIFSPSVALPAYQINRSSFLSRGCQCIQIRDSQNGFHQYRLPYNDYDRLDRTAAHPHGKSGCTAVGIHLPVRIL